MIFEGDRGERKGIKRKNIARTRIRTHARAEKERERHREGPREKQGNEKRKERFAVSGTLATNLDRARVQGKSRNFSLRCALLVEREEARKRKKEGKKRIVSRTNGTIRAYRISFEKQVTEGSSRFERKNSSTRGEKRPHVLRVHRCTNLSISDRAGHPEEHVAGQDRRGRLSLTTVLDR